MSTRILIVDDDPIQRRSLEANVLRMGYRTILADGGINAFGFIASRKDISLVLLDLSMPDLDGCAVIARMREANIKIPVIALVQAEEIEKAMQAIRLGAADFMTKPVVFERMQVSVANAFKLDSLTQELERTRSSQKPHILLSDMVSKSTEMEKVIGLARRVIPLDTPLLIEGDVGTGKETLARAIASGGARWKGPFVTVDCRALSKDNADKVIFGQNDIHEVGSAPIQIAGKIGEAKGGTIFFDEIRSLPYRTQLRLFSVMKLEHSSGCDGQEMPLSDTRVIASNSHSVAELVHLGQFHPGLYNLLASFSICMPVLRNRIVDIPILAHEFLMQFASEERLGHITGITPYAIECLKAYDWPGNVRELKNAIFQAVLLSNENALTVSDFRNIGLRTVSSSNQGDLVDLSSKGRVIAQGRQGQVDSLNSEGEVRTLAATEEQMIRFAVAHYDGQISEVARRLGIGRTTLYRKLKEYGIDVASIAGRMRDEETFVEPSSKKRAII
ncbi:sigma-54 dependent transcriptional regulator [Ochrobactrum sp. Marseille-Q0166]|uniref:sigma-54-dependent transcriptional regulator n=1 Tax=Ochrobactrum sp. Marseille-Q0166 TaxID=2761105 RepID=UPI00165620B9|nr:sigma-54 dependent transcriptional regulator [Ochrobactrum sp. Marseille-Q0166]MBC8718875.1 sigma-54-dependent Fis family transcriptional regulator [Ochrobactrum sp. Marseille-Q0166]